MKIIRSLSFSRRTAQLELEALRRSIQQAGQYLLKNKKIYF